jgi:Hg(II)-responsive transcriptional regulator
MRIGEAAREAGVNVQTLRYYERRGLLPKARRSSSGYRKYTGDEVQVVRFIKRAQELGFTLTDVNALLRLAPVEPKSCSAVQALASSKLDELDRKIAMLKSMRRSLHELVTTCDRPRRRSACPMLDALGEGAS